MGGNREQRDNGFLWSWWKCPKSDGVGCMTVSLLKSPAHFKSVESKVCELHSSKAKVKDKDSQEKTVAIRKQAAEEQPGQ